MAITYVAGNRAIGTNAERLALNIYPDGLGTSADATVTGSPTRTTTGKLGSYATTNIDGCAFTIPNSTTNFGFLSDQSYSLAFWVKKASSGATVIIGSSDGGGGWCDVDGGAADGRSVRDRRAK
mgnify:CR=1 FL=1